MNKNEDEAYSLQYEEVLFKLIMNSASKSEGEIFNNENEELKQLEEYSLSEYTLKEFNKKLEKQFRAKFTNGLFSKTKNAFNKSAAVILLATLISTAIAFSVDASRMKILNLLLDVNEQFTRITYSDNDSNRTSQTQNNEFEKSEKLKYSPEYIPEGFYAVNSSASNGMSLISYENKQKLFIRFSEMAPENAINLDTEDAELIENVKIKSFDALLVKKGNIVSIVWSNNDMCFSIIAQLDVEEIVKIAESVELLK